MNQGALHYRSASKRKAIPITSLVDVVFILLLFFMLTSSFLDWNDIQLKSAVGGSTYSASPDQTQLIVLDARGRVSLYGEQAQKDLALPKLIPSLKQDLPTVLFPHHDVTVQSIVSTLDQFSELGFEQVSLGRVLEKQGQR